MAHFSLPEVIATRGDVLRLYRELEALERYFKARTQQQTPKISRNLSVFARDNKIDLNDAGVRAEALEFMAQLKKSAPIMHMSFASDPPAPVVVKIVSWMRKQAHPHTLMQVGVQPNIAGGCTLRTTSKYFDFSLRRHFKDHYKQLGEAVHQVSDRARSETSA